MNEDKYKNNNNYSRFQRDIDIKRQKIAAAIHLVTEHLGDQEPYRVLLRECAARMCTTASSGVYDTYSLIQLLQSASLARIIKKENASIILEEIQKLPDGHNQRTRTPLEELFLEEVPYEDRQYSTIKDTKGTHKYISQSSTSIQSPIKKDITFYSQEKGNDYKKERKEKIKEYVFLKKSVVVKDIISLFPDVTEKTIQRDLLSLVHEGAIEKKGDKRWSTYSPVL